MNNFYRKDGWVKTTLGPAVAGAKIFLCYQPANISSAPPNPIVSIFSDPEGLAPITQPVITDGFGHYDYYVAPGLYTEIVVFGGKIQQVYPDQSIGNVGTAGSSSTFLMETNGVPNSSQFLQNLVQGVGISISSDNAGNTTISNTGLSSTSVQNFSNTASNVGFSGTSNAFITASGTISLTLVTAVGVAGNTITFFNTGTGTITINPFSGQHFNQVLTSYALTNTNQSITIGSDGSNWFIVATAN